MPVLPSSLYCLWFFHLSLPSPCLYRASAQIFHYILLPLLTTTISMAFTVRLWMLMPHSYTGAAHPSLPLHCPLFCIFFSTLLLRESDVDMLTHTTPVLHLFISTAINFHSSFIHCSQSTTQSTTLPPASTTTIENYFLNSMICSFTHIYLLLN